MAKWLKAFAFGLLVAVLVYILLVLRGEMILRWGW